MRDPTPQSPCVLQTFGLAFQTEKQPFCFHFQTSKITLEINFFSVEFQRFYTHMRAKFAWRQPLVKQMPALCSGCARHPLLWWVFTTACLQVLIFIQLGINTASGPFFFFFPGRTCTCLDTVCSSSAIPGNLSQEWLPQWPRKQKGF